ncbi:hypothetical protein [Paraclostridium sordellii]|uniref:hypothetical protein n=1 Tax=Paraclostridium sordellii TaxID=1505 RepID=UPI0022E2D029|nr:hypothetical protein [Paeniclostridium sordellii]
MDFLEEIKESFRNLSENDFRKVQDLKKQLKSFIESQLKEHYSKKFIIKLNNIKFSQQYYFINDSNNLDQNKDLFDNGIIDVCNLIDEILSNLEEYKKSDYIHQEIVFGDKVYGDKSGRDIYKADGDITFGNKTTLSPELNSLKKRINEEVDEKELKEDLIRIIEDINKNQNNKEKKIQLANKLWERGAQFMTILGPFAPYLFGL